MIARQNCSKTASNKTSYARRAEDSIVANGQVNLSRNIIDAIIIVKGVMHWSWLVICQILPSSTPGE